MKDFKDFTKEERCGMSNFYTFTKPNRKGEKMQCEISWCSGNGKKNDLPHLWFKEGMTSKVIENYLACDVYVTDKDDNCFRKYDFTKWEVKKDSQGKIISGCSVIDFDWLLESTEENEQKLLNELARRFYSEEGAEK